ncbi:regulator of sigma E protease [Trypanosoma cruzi]|nr:regulator of sigma E protease [Trypanosoma cruzi]
MCMTPATGRPSSSVAHGSAHTPPSAAATYNTVSESATPVEQCPSGTVNRLQTLPAANEYTVSGPYSGCTSRRSACSYTAAGTVSSARILPCAEDRTPSSKWRLSFNEFIA